MRAQSSLERRLRFAFGGTFPDAVCSKLYALIFMDETNERAGSGCRRNFLTKVAAAIIGTVLGLVPLGAGLLVFLDPLRRKSATNGFLKVTTLKAVSEDGIPRKFPVLATRVDAWNK